MAKQSFSVGQVLTAAQMNSLQQTAMLGGSATAKTASYTLVAADAGTVVSVNSTSATTITVNTALFSAGDTVTIQNWGTGAVTITAGTATVNTAGSLIVPQYDGGVLYFTSASAAIYFDFVQAGAVSPLTTKGDLYGFGTSDARIPIGTNNHVLTADSTETLGLKWAAPAAPTFVGVNAYRNGASASLTANTAFFIPLTAELYKSESGFHDNSTNNERLTIPTGKGGKYLLSAVVRWSGAPTYFELNFWKNTSNNVQDGLNTMISKVTQTSASVGISGSIVTELAAADYVRVAITQSATGTDPLYCVFSATYLGA
jgi:hypothetical protein